MHSKSPPPPPLPPATTACDNATHIQHEYATRFSSERIYVPTVSPTQAEAPTAAIIDISIAHSPDSDDAFMFYGLATNKVRVPGYRFTHTLCDIETLNQRARDEAFFDVTAISFHAYPYLQHNYTLMGCGGSVGEGYGPMVVSTQAART